MSVWVGVDPGSRWTGITVRDGTQLLGWRVVDVQDIEPGADEPGLATKEAIVLAVGELADPATARIAVERLNTPSPHMGMIEVGNLLATANLIGYLQCAFPAAVLVAPARHGQHTLASYPRELITKREVQHADRARTWLKPAPYKGGSIMRHARAAFDVAGAGTAAARIQLALARHANTHP